MRPPKMEIMLEFTKFRKFPQKKKHLCFSFKIQFSCLNGEKVRFCLQARKHFLMAGTTLPSFVVQSQCVNVASLHARSARDPGIHIWENKTLRQKSFIHTCHCCSSHRLSLPCGILNVTLKNHSFFPNTERCQLLEPELTYEASSIAAVPTSWSFPRSTDMDERNLSMQFTAKCRVSFWSQSF